MVGCLSGLRQARWRYSGPPLWRDDGHLPVQQRAKAYPGVIQRQREHSPQGVWHGRSGGQVTPGGDAHLRYRYRLLTPRVIAQTPPPGPGFTTETESAAAEATSLAGIVAVRRVLLTKVVVRLEP